MDSRSFAIPQVRDFRALWGGIAFIITGLVLALIAGIYFVFEARAAEALKSRMLWEVVLNFQMLSLALIWFAFADRFERTQGVWKGLLFANFCFAVLVNCAPAGFFIFITQHAWADTFPHRDQMKVIVQICVAFWFAFEFLLQVFFWSITGIVAPRGGKSQERSARSRLLALWPAWSALASLIIASRTDITFFYVAIPVLGYAQGAKDYFSRAYRWSTDANFY